MKNKEYSKWILGLGYLFLAIIILINFIRQTPEGRTSAIVQAAVQSDPDLERMNRQVEEERSLNRELKKMLRGYQQAFGATSDLGMNTAKLSPADLEGVLRSGIPAISRHLLLESQVNAPSPFIPGKNPYVSFLPPVSSLTPELSMGQPSEISLLCDPKIPFLMKGNWQTSAVSDARIPGGGAPRSGSQQEFFGAVPGAAMPPVNPAPGFPRAEAR